MIAVLLDGPTFASAAEAVAETARVFLAAVFLVAGLAKLRANVDFRKALGGLGHVPIGLLAPLAIAVPFAELAAAVLLLALPLAGAVLTLALLMIFGLVAEVVRRENRAVSCRCFGVLGSARLGGHTVVRNAGLALVAAAVVAGRPEWPPRSLPLALLAVALFVHVSLVGAGYSTLRLPAPSNEEVSSGTRAEAG